MVNPTSGYWYTTLDGHNVDIQNFDPVDIDPHTMATVLSRTCRFGGHCRTVYSVAEHSVRVWDLVREKTDDVHLHIAALLHDGHEAYTGFGDVIRPAKEMLGVIIRDIEARCDVAIAGRWGIDPELFHDPIIKEADMVMLATEQRDLMRKHDGGPVDNWIDMPDVSHMLTIMPVGRHIARVMFESAALSYL
jgi:hypothetical protein